MPETRIGRIPPKAAIAVSGYREPPQPTRCTQSADQLPGSQGNRVKEGRSGALPWNPSKGLCLLGSHQRRGLWSLFNWLG
jgi:hypothetical protein